VEATGAYGLVLGANTTNDGMIEVTHVISLTGNDDVVTGATAASTLTNMAAISGRGAPGAASMTLMNEARGVIDGVGALTIDTGANTIINAGLIEATAGQTQIASAVYNAGVLAASGATSPSWALSRAPATRR